MPEPLCVWLPRLTRILTRLPALRLMNSSITEELFFTGLIGNVSIDSIIPYILKMETAEYNSQEPESIEWRPITPAPRTDYSIFTSGTLFASNGVMLNQSTILQQPPCFIKTEVAKSVKIPRYIKNFGIGKARKTLGMFLEDIQYNSVSGQNVMAQKKWMISSLQLKVTVLLMCLSVW